MIKESPHVRHDMGVIIRWEIQLGGNIFIVEQFRGYFKCASCASRVCKHSNLADQLEHNWLMANLNEAPGHCFFCGRIAPERNGIAICASCAW